MTEAFLVSQILLWCLVLVLGGLVLVLARQVGVLHERIAPAGALALSSGPQVGEGAPELSVAAFDGSNREIGSANDERRSTLLFFASPRCPTCKELVPTARRLAREFDVEFLVGSDGAELDHERFVREQRLDRSRYVVSQQLGLAFQIPKLPYAVLIDGDGIVRAQGLVNTREHVESLFDAADLGVASIQDYMQVAQVAEGARA